MPDVLTEKIKIREWLLRNDKTQIWLAAKAGISPSHLSLILDGFRIAKPKVAMRIYAATGVKLPDSADVLVAGRS